MDWWDLSGEERAYMTSVAALEGVNLNTPPAPIDGNNRAQVGEQSRGTENLDGLADIREMGTINNFAPEETIRNVAVIESDNAETPVTVGEPTKICLR